MDLAIVGSGLMAEEYCKVLKDLGHNFVVVGNSEQSGASFEQKTGIPVERGGVDKWLENSNKVPSKAIVAVSENLLGDVTRSLARAGVASILLEKPGGSSIDDIRKTAEIAAERSTDIRIGYNRRFYASVEKARDIISQDGGVISFSFEFTEWSHLISTLNKPKQTLAEWFLHNSSHVIDLAFHLGGKPAELCSYCTGGTEWHPAGSVYAGSGITQNGALFCYQANWTGPGRWGIELTTSRHRLILRPLEQLQIQQIGSVAIEPVEIKNQYDLLYKPGIYRQTEAYLAGDHSLLWNISSQVSMLPIYSKMNTRFPGNNPRGL